MAPACDMKLSQNTPDTRFSPPLFQTVLHFKQNERKGKKGGRRRKKKWTRGTRRMCNSITISFIHLSCPCASSGESGPLILALFLPLYSACVKAFLSVSPPFLSALNRPDSCGFNHRSGVWLLCSLSFSGIKEQLTRAAVFVHSFFPDYPEATAAHHMHF